MKRAGVPRVSGDTRGAACEPQPAPHGNDRVVPTDEDVQFYEDHGWWVAPRVLSDYELDAAWAGADEFYATGGEPLPVESGFRGWTTADGMDVLRNNEFVSLRSRALAQVALHPAIGAIAARLARASEVRLLDDQLIWKPSDPDGSKAIIGWHTDHAYRGTCSSDRLLTAWIPFQDVTADTGALTVLDRSHRWTGTQHMRSFNDDDLDRIARERAAQGREVERVPFAMKRGQVSFHHGWTVHGSAANRSAAPRLAMAVHFQDGENRYVPALSPDGTPVQMADELFCRRLSDGSPDFADPAIFPRIWPVG